MESLSVVMPIGAAVATDPWRSRAFGWLQLRYERLLSDAELVLGTNADEPFNRGAARNDAFARASGDVLLVADADTVFHASQVHAGLALLEAGAPWVVCYRADGGYYNLTAEATDRVLTSPPTVSIAEPTDPSDWEQRITSWAGLLLVPRAAWETVGGYDEEFRFWGYDDNAFRFALDRLVGPHARVESGYALHLWHPRTEAENFGNPEIARNRHRCHQYQLGLLP